MDRLTAVRVSGGGDGRQGGISLGNLFDVVKAHDQEIPADAPSDLVAARNHSQGDKVIETHRRVHACVVGKQLARGAAAERAAGLAGHDDRLQPHVRQDIQIARLAFLGHGPAFKPPDKGDATRPGGYEMLRRLAAARHVVGRNQREPVQPLIDAAQHLHGGNAAARYGIKGCSGLAIGRADDQRRHAMFNHRTHDLVLQLRAFIGVGDNRRIAALRQRHLQRCGEFGEERVAQIVDHKANQPGIRHSHVGGGAIVDIADFSHRPAHQGAGFLAHRRAVLQHKADRRFRDACALGHVDDGRSAVDAHMVWIHRIDCRNPRRLMRKDDGA